MDVPPPVPTAGPAVEDLPTEVGIEPQGPFMPGGAEAQPRPIEPLPAPVPVAGPAAEEPPTQPVTLPPPEPEPVDAGLELPAEPPRFGETDIVMESIEAPADVTAAPGPPLEPPTEEDIKLVIPAELAVDVAKASKILAGKVLRIPFDVVGLGTRAVESVQQAMTAAPFLEEMGEQLVEGWKDPKQNAFEWAGELTEKMIAGEPETAKEMAMHGQANIIINSAMIVAAAPAVAALPKYVADVTRNTLARARVTADFFRKVKITPEEMVAVRRVINRVGISEEEAMKGLTLKQRGLYRAIMQDKQIARTGKMSKLDLDDLMSQEEMAAIIEVKPPAAPPDVTKPAPEGAKAPDGKAPPAEPLPPKVTEPAPPLPQPPEAAKIFEKDLVRMWKQEGGEAGTKMVFTEWKDDFLKALTREKAPKAPPLKVTEPPAAVPSEAELSRLWKQEVETAGVEMGFTEWKDDFLKALTKEKAPKVERRAPKAAERETRVMEEFSRSLEKGGMESKEATTRVKNIMEKLPEKDRAAMVKHLGGLGDLAYTDQLTGLKNRNWATREGLLQERAGEKPTGTVSTILLDIDKFKQLNDKWGHPAGDERLSALGELVNKVTEGKAAAVRYGGEEFSIHKIEGVTREEMLDIVDGLRKQAKELKFTTGPQGINFSAGYGETVELADNQLFLAKEAGRDQTFLEGKKYGVQAKVRKAEGGKPGVRKADVPKGPGSEVKPPEKGKAPEVPVKPKFEQALYQGKGKTPTEIYGEQAVKEGRAVPLFGKGEYYSFSKPEAEAFGKVTTKQVSLTNPFTIDSDKVWFKLLKDAKTPHLNNMSKEFYSEPGKIPAAADKLQKFLKDQGYDGIIVKLDPTGDKTKRLRNMAGVDQVVVFPKKPPKAPQKAKPPAPAVKPPIFKPVPPKETGFVKQGQSFINYEGTETRASSPEVKSFGEPIIEKWGEDFELLSAIRESNPETFPIADFLVDIPKQAFFQIKKGEPTRRGIDDILNERGIKQNDAQDKAIAEAVAFYHSKAYQKKPTNKEILRQYVEARQKAGDPEFITTQKEAEELMAAQQKEIEAAEVAEKVIKKREAEEEILRTSSEGTIEEDMGELPFSKRPIESESEPQIRIEPGKLKIIAEKQFEEAAKNLNPSDVKSVAINVSPKFSYAGKHHVFSAGEEAALYVDKKTGKATVHINPEISVDRLSNVIFHELIGHFGAAKIINTRPEIKARLKALFLADQKSDLVQTIKKRYKTEDQQFDEWIANRVADHAQDKLKGKEKRLGRKIYETIRNFIQSIIKKLRRKPVKTSELKEIVDKDISLLVNAIKNPIRAVDLEGRTIMPRQLELFDNFIVPTEKASEIFIRRVQDKFRRLKITQQAIEKWRGKKLPDEVDAYLAEELFQGKAERALEKFEEKFFDPITTALAKSEIDVKDLELFLYAKHAPERNKYISEINPKFKDPGAAGSGMDNETAKAIVSAFDQAGLREKAEEIANIFYKMNDERLRLLEVSGLESKEAINKWRRYKFYAPLKGFEKAPDDLKDLLRSGEKIGRGYDIRGRESRRALGRKTRAGHIIAQALSQTEATIIRAEKNRVGQSFLNLIRENPNPDVWEINKKYKTPAFSKAKGEVIEAFNYGKHLDEVLTVKEAGKEFYITIKDPNLAKAMKNLGPEKTGWALRTFSRINRYLALVNTSMSPEFVASNLIRDVQTAVINISAEDSFKLATDAVRDVPNAISGAFKAIKGIKGGKWTEEYRDFVEAGGKIGFFGLEDITVKQRNIIKRIQRLRKGNRASTTNVLRSMKALIMDVNMAVENGIRLSLYVHLKNRGVSKSRAASASKNVTVNFNRKGELGPLFNAGYLFAGAGIQGSARLFKVMKSKRMKKIGASVVVGSFLMAELNRTLAGEDEDGENRFDKISDWNRHHNFILQHPGSIGHNKFPLPYGYNVFWAAGQAINDVVHGSDLVKSSAQLVGTILNAFNPLGGQGLLQTLSPTAIDPILELGMNENFMGTPIRPEQPPFGPTKPKSQLYFKTVSKASKRISENLNEYTGGSTFRPGLIDVSPENLDHVFYFLSGGAGRFISQTMDAIGDVYQGNPPPVRKVPFLRKFYGEVPEYRDRQKFYENAQDLEVLKMELKDLEDTEDPTLTRFKAKNFEKIQLLGDLKAVSKEVRRLRIDKIKNEKARNMEKAEEADKKTTSLIKEFNRKYDEAKKKEKIITPERAFRSDLEIMSQIVVAPATVEKRIKVAAWYKTLKPTEKKRFREYLEKERKVIPGKELVRFIPGKIRGDIYKSFSKKRVAVVRRRRKKEITPAEATREIDALKADRDKFVNDLN